MRKYLQVSFWTLRGTRKIIDLGKAYGEFIIYDGTIPKYHIECFDDAAANKLVNGLLESKRETIDSIIKKINIKNDTRLSLGKGWPWVVINEAERTVSLDLPPLPIDLLNSIS